MASALRPSWRRSAPTFGPDELDALHLERPDPLLERVLEQADVLLLAALARLALLRAVRRPRLRLGSLRDLAAPADT